MELKYSPCSVLFFPCVVFRYKICYHPHLSLCENIDVVFYRSGPKGRDLAFWRENLRVYRKEGYKLQLSSCFNQLVKAACSL